MRKLFFLGILSLLFVQCNDESSEPEVKTAESYLPLAVGNYWIYENCRIDSLGNETKLSQIDTVIITKDTLINNKKYFVFEGTHYPSSEKLILSIKRDSIGFLVNEKGSITFSIDNFTDTLYSSIIIHEGDTLLMSDYKMENPGISIEVPAGIFSNVLNFKGFRYTIENGIIIKDKKPLNNYYAKGVGKINSNFFYQSQDYIQYERRLIKYHIEEQ